MIDVTDCLEARDAFRGMKNFCFWLMLISLLVLQGLFWLERAGLIERGPSCALQKSCGFVCPVQAPIPETNQEPSEPVDSSAEKVQEDNVKKSPDEQGTQVIPLETIAQQAQQVTEEAQSEPSEDKTEEEAVDWSKIKISCRHTFLLICCFNFLLLFSGVLYCLILLMTLKISLISRLGGINHISRAFFISLFLLVLLFPWQSIAPRVLIGVVYLPKELLCFYPYKADASRIWAVMMYLRFVGLWLAAIWLLLWSWARSGRWYRATQRRLGIVP